MYDYLMLSRNLLPARPGCILGINAGIGYEIRVSAMTEEADRTTGEIRPIFLRSRMDTNSGAFRHYGFISMDEREVFDALVTVKSVGWDTALKILGIGWDVVLQFAAKGDVDEFKKIKGIGPKAAVRLIESTALLALLEKKLLPKSATD